ncbi:hypothetical protein SBADM41S_10681 [Streptomyces badius]
MSQAKLTREISFSVVDAGLGWLAVVMAVNVVIALYYYLQWTAILFRGPDGAPEKAGPDTASPAPAAARRFRAPTPLTTAIVLTSTAGILLSGVLADRPALRRRQPLLRAPDPAGPVCPRCPPQGMVLAAYVTYSAWTRRGNELCITIIGIPFGAAAFRIGVYALWPFGHTVVDRRNAGSPSCVGNVLWLVLAGWCGSPSATSPPASRCASPSSGSPWASPTSS